MSERQHNIKINTIGSAACEISLNHILIALEDPKLTRKVMRRHNQIRNGLKKLEALKDDRGFFTSMASLFYKSQEKAFETNKGKIPDTVYTHALCCFRALYRQSIQRTSSS